MSTDQDTNNGTTISDLRATGISTLRDIALTSDDDMLRLQAATTLVRLANNPGAV